MRVRSLTLIGNVLIIMIVNNLLSCVCMAWLDWAKHENKFKQSVYVYIVVLLGIVANIVVCLKRLKL